MQVASNDALKPVVITANGDTIGVSLSGDTSFRRKSDPTAILQQFSAGSDIDLIFEKDQEAAKIKGRHGQQKRNHGARRANAAG